MLKIKLAKKEAMGCVCSDIKVFFKKRISNKKNVLSFIISKKNIPLAVNRNLMKRRIRSIVRSLISEKLLSNEIQLSFVVNKLIKLDKQSLLKKINYSLKRSKKNV